MEFDFTLSIINHDTDIEILTGFTSTEEDAEETALETVESLLEDHKDLSMITYDYWRA